MSSFHMDSTSRSARENFSRAGARMNLEVVTVGAEPSSALVWPEIGWVVPGRNLPQSELRLFAGWERLKLTHSGPDPAKIDSRAFNASHSEQSFGNRWQYFRCFSESQHHSITAPHRPDMFVLTAPESMGRYFRSGRQRYKTWDPPRYWCARLPAPGEKRPNVCLRVKVTDVATPRCVSVPTHREGSREGKRKQPIWIASSQTLVPPPQSLTREYLNKNTRIYSV